MVSWLSELSPWERERVRGVQKNTDGMDEWIIGYCRLWYGYTEKISKKKIVFQEEIKKKIISMKKTFKMFIIMKLMSKLKVLSYHKS